MAYIATSRHEDALDILQEAMYALAKYYANKSVDEWPALFHRILQNKIRDWYRLHALKNRIFFWQTNDSPLHEVELYEDEVNLQPANVLQSEQISKSIEKALSKLPLRQQQAFLLRAWQGLSVKQTADALQISEGSVKTHYSRALDSLRQNLKQLEVACDGE